MIITGEKRNYFILVSEFLSDLSPLNNINLIEDPIIAKNEEILKQTSELSIGK